MDSHFIETVLNLPEFRVFNFELGDFGLYLHLQRREPAIVCPRCHQVCERTKESRTRYLRDLPILGIHTNRDKLSSIAYSEELISCTISYAITGGVVR